MSKRFLLSLYVGGLLALASIAVIKQAGFRVNTSPSIPLGIYRTTTSPLSVGSYVLLCPENKEPFITAQNAY